MQIIGKTRITLECLESSKAPTSGIKLGRIEKSFRKPVFGKLEMKTLHGFGRISGNKNLHC